MKLLFYISSIRGGGAERVIIVICNKLVERGYEIYLATNLKIPFVYEPDERIKLADIYVERSGNKVRNVYRYAKRIRQVAKVVNPDIIISFIWPLNSVVIPAVAGLRAPVIASEHSTFDKKMSFYEYFTRFYMNRWAKKVTILTHYDYNYLGKRLPNKLVLPNPLPYKPAEENVERKKRILAVGDINRWYVKGFDTLIRVWAGIASGYPGWQLYIAGGGSPENLSVLKNMAEEYKVSDSVCFTGFRNDIDKLMRESSVFVLSSRYEGFPMVVLEAMSQGCACVCFDCKTGPAEIIDPGKTGLLVKNQDEGDLKNNLIKVMDDGSLRSELSARAMDEIRRFSAGTITDRWEALFREIAG